jgi:trehalose 6-phosphate synthase
VWVSWSVRGSDAGEAPDHDQTFGAVVTGEEWSPRAGQRSESGRASLVVATNRAPVEFTTTPDGRVVERRGAGGLVTVLNAALAGRHGTWVAAAVYGKDRVAAGLDGEPFPVNLLEGTIGLWCVVLNEADYRAYYHDVSTELLWFLHHEMLDDVRFDDQPGERLSRGWDAYARVNELFAKACDAEVAHSGTVLVLDYHLCLVPGLLRARRPDVRIAHFTMTPWASPEHFRRLPDAVARELVDGMLGGDIVAFLASRWRNAFVATCAALGYLIDSHMTRVRAVDGRWVAARSFPVGVDIQALQRRAAREEVANHKEAIRALVRDRRLVVRVDRMEPSKNVLRGLAAFRELLVHVPSLRGQIVHFVIAYASRADSPVYLRYADAVRAGVDAINGRFGTPGWVPIVLREQNDVDQALAAMALADVMIVNPVRDGMNLIAKEAAVMSERNLALILSNSAGAAEDLSSGSLLVDPFDVFALRDAIDTALQLPADVRATNLQRLRAGAGALPPQAWLAAVMAELAGIKD